MSKFSLHSEWLSLINVSGPFLAEPVLDSVFPQGLAILDSNKKRAVRQAYYELKDSLDEGEAIYSKLHDAWIKYILSDVLEWDENRAGENLKSAAALGNHFTHTVVGQAAQLKPDYTFSANSAVESAELLVVQYPPETKLEAPLNTDGWIASPSERMVELCRAKDVRLGLVTNGEHWMFIDAPIGRITTFASWYSGLWVQEPKTLQAFVNLFELRRFFLPQDSQLPALLDRSVEFQDDVTEALGEQVGRAVEVLIQAFDRADIDRNHTLLSGVKPAELYEAGLTIMMRIVFLLSAEERGLLLLGDERYESNYAITTLRSQLRETPDEILEKRWDAWSRLLALFRAVYGGVDHQTMRLPALGGSLFDPDRFPFLEGRGKGTKWLEAEAQPLPIDNRTVLLLLEAVQIYRGRTLSYRALDVEQIGYVYEGLLERTAVKAKDVTLDLKATKSAKKPWVTLSEIEEALETETISKLLKERTKSSANRIKNDLNKAADAEALSRLLVACQNDEALKDKLVPFINFIRLDTWSYPLVYPKGSFMVTAGLDRRESGTHYTPKSFTEEVVETTLTPLVYFGPAEGLPKEGWKLKSAKEILDLRICDPAMGSGAFLVQVCRWLSEKLVEAWLSAEQNGLAVLISGKVTTNDKTHELAPDNLEERITLAKRLVAERCIYGVDMNPLAVELAKLSIWLVTLSKGRPFGFLDHNLKAGDSLLGITSIEQLTTLTMSNPQEASKKLFAHNVDEAVERAIALRKEIRAKPVYDIRDVAVMENLDTQAKSEIRISCLIADALVGEALSSKSPKVDTTKLSVFVGEVLGGNERSVSELKRLSKQKLSIGLPINKPPRKTFHWPLEFPEVFSKDKGGFDSFVGNPPFVGGQKLSGTFGKPYQKFLVNHLCYKENSAVDLVVFFFLRKMTLLNQSGMLGFIARRSVSEGKNREAGLGQILQTEATIYEARTNIVWPGKASVIVHQIHISKAPWKSNCDLNGSPVKMIYEDLEAAPFWEAKTLNANTNRIYQGSILLGEGFKLDEVTAKTWLDNDARNSDVLFPFLGGNEVNSNPDYAPSCWVINFWDWSIETAKEYETPFNQIVDKVKSDRQSQNDGSAAKNKWWLHLRARPELYHAVGRGKSFHNHPKDWNKNKSAKKRVIAISTGVTKYPAFTFLRPDALYSNKLCILADDRYSMLAMLTSDVHGVWTWKQKTSLGGDLYSLVYAHGNIFETFPFPTGFLENGDKGLEELGERFFRKRHDYMTSKGVGLTNFYNIFHDHTNDQSDISDLRDLQKQINKTVFKLYEWNDFDVNTEFCEVGYLPAGTNNRFTVSESCRLQIIQSLSVLNRACWEREHQQPSIKTNVKKPKVSKKSTPEGPDLFSTSISDNNGIN